MCIRDSSISENKRSRARVSAASFREESPQRRGGRREDAEVISTISASSLRSLRLCGDSSLSVRRFWFRRRDFRLFIHHKGLHSFVPQKTLWRTCIERIAP